MARVLTDIPRCKSCSFCIFSCPRQAISKSGKFNSEGYEYVEIDSEKCVACGVCYTVCPDGVFTIEE